MTLPSQTASKLNKWHQNTSGGFSDRIASQCQLPNFAPKRQPKVPSTSRSLSLLVQTSIESSIEQGVESMMPSSSVPSLSDGSTSTSSSGSIEKGNMTGLGNYNLEDDGTGNLIVPPLVFSSSSQFQSIYQCLFHTLNCEQRFDNFEEWKTHVLSHFRALPLPESARCQLCRHWFRDPRQGKAWDNMLEHVATRHFESGQTLQSSRFDFELMRYLYCSKIISEEQFKASQLLPPITSPAYHQTQDSIRSSIGSSDEPFCSQYNSRREQRLRQQRRGVRVA